MRQKTLGLLLGLLAVCSVAAAQQHWPERPVTIVAPNAPGGLSDTLASHDIVYGIGTLSSGKTMQDTGKTRMIGMLSTKRSALYPDLPPFKEVGVDDPTFQLLGWYGEIPLHRNLLRTAGVRLYE